MKQVIVVRKDLKMSIGKTAAQVAHASIEAAEKSKWKKDWIADSQKKTVLKCDTDEELHAIYDAAKRSGLPASIIADAGRTELPPGTVTCVGIGPAPEEQIDKITGKLKLL